jgi:ABC-type branched-subunit amino acid transport system substrate-binding protein
MALPLGHAGEREHGTVARQQVLGGGERFEEGAGGPARGAAPPEQKSGSPADAPAGGPLRVGIVPGDAAQEAGFRAYVNRVNQAGGVRGHSIELVTVGPAAPASDTIATVNLSPQPVAGPGGAPGWATGPLLETLTATENLLTGNGAVFSFAGVPERQGHLAADALFPAPAAAGTRAVIYVPAAPGPLRDTVPTAIKAVLKDRNVSVSVVTYDASAASDPAARKPLPAADAAFLSLDPAAARAWVAQAKAEAYRPAGGVAGIYSLADEALLPDLPDGARVVSPYVVPAGDEGQALRSAGAGTSAPVLHGWATAKSLAAAVWRSGADTPAELQSALEGLAGWSSGLAPAYETRTGTRSRTPEGVVFRVQSQAFTSEGGFRRDPY